jgi:hypothetical protein
LHNVASRPARVGDKLPVGEPNVAVCLLPGTELAFENDVNVKCNQLFLSFFRRKEKECLGKLVRFRQINLHNRQAHHDAVEFPNGKVVLLTTLCEGQRATVLQLPAALQPTQHGRSAPIEAAAESRVIDLAPTGGDSWALTP